jgi:peptidoglycan/LPS O-acetylase OafA/YrhL
MTEPMKGEIRALTALRGIAAMAVVLQHFSSSAQEFAVRAIPSLAPHGYMAVDFFFALSGFIMAYTYADGFEARGWRAYPDFIGRRVARIWPLQAVVVLVLAGLADLSLSGHRSFFDIASNLLMLQGFGLGENMNGPSGSVSQEVGAYILFPILLAIAMNRRRSIVAVGLCLSVALVCWEAAQEPRLGLASREIANNVIRCLAEFTMGLGAYRLYRAQRLPWLSADWVAAGLTAACVASLLLRLDLPAALMFPFLVVAFACNKGWPARLVASPLPYFLGVISYSLYLIHSPLRYAEFRLLGSFHPGVLSVSAALAVAALGSLTAIPVAWLTYRSIEHPGRDVFRRLLRSRSPREIKVLPQPQ